MATFTNDLIGKTVSFQVYPSAILTDEFRDVKVIGVVNYEAANNYISAARMHTNVYPTLPQGVPDDHRLYEYALIRKQDGKLTAVGVPWIREASLEVTGTIEILVTIRGKGIDDIPRIRQILTQNGIDNIAITTNSKI